MDTYLKKFVKPLICVVSWFLNKIIPRDKYLIILTGTNVYKYNENARYLYEYISNKPDFKATWVTDDLKIYSYLLSKGFRVVMQKSFKGYFTYLRAGVVIGTGIFYPDFMNAVDGRALKISLWHGVGPRSTNAGNDGSAKDKYFLSQMEIIKKVHEFDYVNFTSPFTSIVIGKLQFLLPESKRIINGYPRCDHLFNKSLMEESLKNKNFSLRYFPNITSNDKIVLYSPTWRITNKRLSFPVRLFNDYALEYLDKFLLENNLYLIISKHPVVNNEEDFSACKRVCYIPEDTLFDVNLLLPEVSILITDYSSIITDFLILDRPIVFVMPDYEEFLYKRGMLEDIRENLPGKEAKSMKELCDILSIYKESPELDSKARMKYLSKYYDININNSCEIFYKFLNNIISRN